MNISYFQYIPNELNYLILCKLNNPTNIINMSYILNFITDKVYWYNKIKNDVVNIDLSHIPDEFVSDNNREKVNIYYQKLNLYNAYHNYLKYKSVMIFYIKSKILRSIINKYILDFEWKVKINYIMQISKDDSKYYASLYEDHGFNSKPVYDGYIDNFVILNLIFYDTVFP